MRASIAGLFFVSFAGAAAFGGLMVTIDPEFPRDTTRVIVNVMEGCATTCECTCATFGDWPEPDHQHIDWYLASEGELCFPCVLLRTEQDLGELPVGEYVVTATEHVVRPLPQSDCWLGTPLGYAEASTSFYVYSRCDVDLDRDVDLADFQEFHGCVTGPVEDVGDESCRVADFDSSDHVDLVDFAIFQQSFTAD